MWSTDICGKTDKNWLPATESKQGCSVTESWRDNQMETFSALLVLCVGNSLVTSEFPSQRPVMQSFDVFFELRLNKWLSKQSRHRWFEMPSGSLWCHCNRLLTYEFHEISVKICFKNYQQLTLKQLGMFSLNVIQFYIFPFNCNISVWNWSIQ